MEKEYTGEDMRKWLKQYYESCGYKVFSYNEQFSPARVALYCHKKDNEEVVEQIVVEPTSDKYLSIKDFFPRLIVPNKVPEMHEITISDASQARFYQYYLPYAKVFFAYPDYAQENVKFHEFEDFCREKGIGLLKVFEQAKPEEIVPARSLFEIIYNKLVDIDRDRDNNIENAVREHLDNNLLYLVYYPEPIYTRRAIIGRDEETKKGLISITLLRKQEDLNVIAYREELKKLASEYFLKATKSFSDYSDYDIAEEYTKKLWNGYLGLDYPDIQRRIESILQRDETYREHFLHQFQVFLIGAYIIDKLYSEIGEKFKEKHQCAIEIVWLAASTFHDFSYGLQNFDTWLLEFFQDTLRVKKERTKERLNFLNLDTAMIREELYDKIVTMTNELKNDWKEDEKENINSFFYEKAVRDRNHGVLSAISFLKLCDDINESKLKINKDGRLQAALAIECHDEDIWEAICGCRGYRRSPTELPKEEDKCLEKCGRKLWNNKKTKIITEKVLSSTTNPNEYKCEDWEREIMLRRTVSQIKFEDYPILFLLIFCDNIQDEGRMTTFESNSQQNLSELIDLAIFDEKGKSITDVKLKSDEALKKEEEIERVSWCLKDDRFCISINGVLKRMNGNGGGG